jgi:hypothetical protein
VRIFVDLSKLVQLNVSNRKVLAEVGQKIAMQKEKKGIGKDMEAAEVLQVPEHPKKRFGYVGYGRREGN